MWRAAPRHHRLLGWDWGEGRGGAGRLAGEQGLQGGTQEAAWQSESRRAEPAPLVQEEAGTLTQCHPWEQKSQPRPRLRGDSVLSPDASAWSCRGEGSLLERGAGPQLSLTSPMSLSGALSKRLRTCSRLSAWRICSRRTCRPGEASRGPWWTNVAPPPPSHETRVKEGGSWQGSLRKRAGQVIKGTRHAVCLALGCPHDRDGHRALTFWSSSSGKNLASPGGGRGLL